MRGVLWQVHIQTFTVVPSRSGVVRTLSEREVLEIFMSRMAALSLSGYIFFGSSVSIAEQVASPAPPLLPLSPPAPRCLEDTAGLSEVLRQRCLQPWDPALPEGLERWCNLSRSEIRGPAGHRFCSVGGRQTLCDLLQVTTVARALLDHDEAVQDRAGASDGKADMQSSNPLWTGDLRERTRQAFAASPRFILLDFRYTAPPPRSLVAQSYARH